MRRIQVKTILVFIVLMCHSPLFSQKDFEKHEFSVHAGYGNMIHRAPTVTLPTYSYQRELAQGVSWDAEYLFRPTKRFLVGAVYSVFSSKGSHAEGKDHIWIHFFGPQAGICNAYTKHWQIRMTMSGGYLFFRNNSEVFGKPRTATAKRVALLFNGNASYKLTPHLGIGLEVQYLLSRLAHMRSYYHEEEVFVRLDEKHLSNLTRLNLSGGLSYYF